MSETNLRPGNAIERPNRASRTGKVECGSDVPPNRRRLPVPETTEQESKDDHLARTPPSDGNAASPERPPAPAPPSAAETRAAATAEDRAARAAEDRRLLERYHRSGDR